MSNILNLKGVKFFAIIVLAVAILATFGMVAVQTASADCSITSTLRAGSVGVEVQCLQSIVGATADGKFGPLTQAAVMAWQSGHGLVADGVVGALTRAALMGAPSGSFPAGCTSASGYSVTTGLACTTVASYPAGCTSASGFSTSTGLACSGATNLPAGCSSTAGYSQSTGLKCDGSGSAPVASAPLAGTDGTISTITQLSQYSAEEVGSGQEAIKVLGFEIEGSSDGDIQLNSIKVRFDSAGNDAGDSDRITDYLSSVDIWQGSTKVGSADTSDFTKVSTGLYTKVITLSNSIVRADVTEKFYVSVDAVSNLDSGDIDSDSWTIALDNVRYVDGSGVVTTETAQIPADMDWDAAADGISLTFASFSTAADTELKISTNSTPGSQVIKVSTTNDTNNVTLLKGKFVLDGTSDVWLDELPITLTTTGDSVDALASSITLVLGDKTYTESLGANCTTSCALGTANPVVTFDNLDYTITAGDTVNFTVKVDLNNIEETGVTATDFDAGDTLLASLTATNRAAMVVENSQGDSLTDATERTGSATGLAQAFYATGIQVALVSVTNSAVNKATINDTSDNADVTFVYDVTAFGADIYVDGTVTEDGDGTYADGTGNNFYVTRADTGATAAALTDVTASLTTDADVGSNTTWLVVQGTTERFTLSVNVANTFTNDAANDALQFQTAITSIGWDTTAIAATTNEYTFNLGKFKNVPVTLGELDA
ncbi:MAG: Cell wall lytic activity [Candidatus Daviesbacteria bacterium GW2011_GWB1_39_5]|nr:MAG: Cell wall lytic activity [Candidatus Daviesbacteria bacterium GW2011_GWB1_39_5]